MDWFDCLASDRARLKQLWNDVRRGRNDRAKRAREEYDALLARSRAIVEARRQRLPRPSYDDALPVNARRAEIAELIRRHPVVIVCGETGSGKTTQLPKLLLELGRGVTGYIGHTQPRRLAARSVATRLAKELKNQVGMGVGVKIRFQDNTRPEAWVKLMTDGILLAETQGDRLLEQYDTIIIDEAHERSLNIDFLLGYLKRILPRRPDLKVVITSATIDADRFSSHFDGAPVIEVSGRLFPVDIRYRPPAEQEGEERDLPEAIVDAVTELRREGPGDVLVFLPGEREIREATEALRKSTFRGVQPDILPLFSRLSAAEQDRVFRDSNGARIVLATNVAETSLTVPGIRYVVDTGLVRVKRYSYRNKVEQLQVESVSQAAARQRAGRCGRVQAGVCIRLYAEEDFNARPAFADPEILRSSLAGVILRMTALGLGDVEAFPFLSPPPGKAVADGYALLQELGAMDEARQLTGIGHGLATMPLDPRIARMIVAARDRGCLREVLVIASALSVQDPRERPVDRQQAADEQHRKWANERSEFLGWVNLWDWMSVESKRLSHRRFADACRSRFLSPLRLREWREVHGQLQALVSEARWRENEQPADYVAIHKALLSGLLGNVGCRADEAGHYLGARGIKFWVHPSSPFARKGGRWLMAAEITETTRLYARCVAHIEPDWIEEVGAHLVRSAVFDPHWEKKSMRVAAWERTTLYGLTLQPRRRIHYGPLAPDEARDIFIRQGLVAGDIDESWVKRWPFFQHNRKLVQEIEHLEHKQRRQDVLVDDALIVAFYDQRVGAGLHNADDFERWRRDAEKPSPRLLFLDKGELMRHEAAGVTTDAFPPRVELGGVAYPLTYHFEPGSPRDGVTLVLPLASLNQLALPRLEWLVPGLVKEKLVQLIKTLPQKIRAKLVPVPEFVSGFLDWIDGDEKRMVMGLIPPLIEYIQDTRGLHARGWTVTVDAFRPEMLPPHFSMNFKLVDEHGRQLDMGRDLVALRAEWGREARSQFADLHETPCEQEALTDWTFGALPELMEVRMGGQAVVGFPALEDQGENVRLTVFDAPEAAEAAHRKGLLRLFMLQFREQVKYFDKNLPDFTQMAMRFMKLGSAEELREQLVARIFSRACLQEPLPVDEAAFRQRCQDAKPRLGLLAQEVCRLVGQILEAWQGLDKKRVALRAFPAAAADVDEQLARLIDKRFVAEAPFDRLQHFPRYLKAVAVRIDKLRADPERDARWMADYSPLEQAWVRRRNAVARQQVSDRRLEQFRWQLEELRVGLFAQELKTPQPVSVKRLQKAWEQMAHG